MCDQSGVYLRANVSRCVVANNVILDCNLLNSVASGADSAINFESGVTAGTGNLIYNNFAANRPNVGERDVTGRMKYLLRNSNTTATGNFIMNNRAVGIETAAVLDAAAPVNLTDSNLLIANGLSSDKALAKFQTTDATLATMTTYPVTPETVLDVLVTVLGKRIDNLAPGSCGSYTRRATIKRLAAGAILVGSVDTIGTDREDDATWGGVTIDANGNNLRVRVTGAATQTISWACSMRVEPRLSVNPL